MDELTYNDVPREIGRLGSKLDQLIRLFVQSTTQNLEDPIKWFDMGEFREYHPDKPARATVYAWVAKGQIPVHKSSKKLTFLKSEIDEWLKEGRVKTNAENKRDVDSYILKSKKRR
jgi:hypothetical protein